MRLSFASIVAVVVLFLSVACVCSAQGAPSAQERMRVPNISLKTIEGKIWQLADEKGSLVIINFWATWCAPCRTEVPLLNKLALEKKDTGLKVVGIALDKEIPLVRTFIAEHKITYPILIPEPDSPLTRLENTPTTLLIDRSGHLAFKYIGAVPEADLRRDLELLERETDSASHLLN